MNVLKSHILILILPLALFTSCGKGYEVRFTNYYTEPIDSVVIGENKLVLKDVELQDDTDYYALSKGKYSVQIISKTKKRFYSSITIPTSGTGKRTIQIDAIEQIYILEE